jgi:hypothetical protein
MRDFKAPKFWVEAILGTIGFIAVILLILVVGAIVL